VSDKAATAGAATVWSPLVLICLGATWFVWGTMFLAIKWALVSFPPFYQMGTQFLAAGLVLAIVARWRGADWPDRSQWAGGAVLGCLLLGAGYGFTALAETSVSSGLVVAFTAIVPAMIVLAELPYGVKPAWRQVVGVTIGLIGIIMMTQGQGFSASLRGLLAIAAACVGWVLTGGAILLIASWALGESPAWPPQPVALASWAYVAFAGSLVSYTAYMLLLERTTPSLAVSYTYVNPVVALVLGVTLGGEVVSHFEWLSVIVVLLGVVLLMWRRD